MRRRLICGSFCLLTLSKRPNEDAEAAEARDPRPCEAAYGTHQCLMVGGWVVGGWGGSLVCGAAYSSSSREGQTKNSGGFLTASVEGLWGWGQPSCRSQRKVDSQLVTAVSSLPPPPPTTGY